METLKSNEILAMVREIIDHLPFDRKPESLYEPIKYVLAGGGKRIRPVLMLMSYNLFRDDPKHILMPAAALEMYHNYTLMHDDVMDNADVRHGVPTVHRKWDNTTAILSGDSMLVMAYKRIMECDADKLKPVLELFTETALQIGEGQQYDLEFEKRNDVAEEEYIEMIRLKTSVLLACATKMGAILADASEADAEMLYKFGEYAGLAFQLQDDLLDVYGDPKVFGKKIGGDIVSNKKTFMLINAFRLADDSQRAELKKWIDAKEFDCDEKIAAVTRLYDEIGIRKLCEDKISLYSCNAMECLNKVSVDNERKVVLESYLSDLMRRKV